VNICSNLEAVHKRDRGLTSVPSGVPEPYFLFSYFVSYVAREILIGEIYFGPYVLYETEVGSFEMSHGENVYTLSQ